MGTSLHRWGFLSVEGSFDLCRRGHAVLAVESLVVDPVDVGEGRSLEVLRPLPGSVVVDQLGLVEPVEALRERIGLRLRLRLIPMVRYELFG